MQCCIEAKTTSPHWFANNTSEIAHKTRQADIPKLNWFPYFICISLRAKQSMSNFAWLSFTLNSALLIPSSLLSCFFIFLLCLCSITFLSTFAFSCFIRCGWNYFSSLWLRWFLTTISWIIRTWIWTWINLNILLLRICVFYHLNFHFVNCVCVSSFSSASPFIQFILFVLFLLFLLFSLMLVLVAYHENNLHLSKMNYLHQSRHNLFMPNFPFWYITCHI